MYIDKQLLLSENQAITSDAVSANVIDLTGSIVADKGPGTPLRPFLLVTQAFNNLTSLTIDAQTSSTENFASPINVFSVTKLLAELTLGAKIPLPPLPEGLNRYFRLNFNVTGTDPSTGKFTAGLVLAEQSNTPTQGNTQ